MDTKNPPARDNKYSATVGKIFQLSPEQKTNTACMVNHKDK